MAWLSPSLTASFLSLATLPLHGPAQPLHQRPSLLCQDRQQWQQEAVLQLQPAMILCLRCRQWCICWMCSTACTRPS